MSVEEYFGSQTLNTILISKIRRSLRNYLIQLKFKCASSLSSSLTTNCYENRKKTRESKHKSGKNHVQAVVNEV